MRQNTKDWIQYASAIALITSAIVLVFTSFLTIERVAEGVNTYVGIAISGGLAIFGVAAYFVNQVAQFKTEIRRELSAQAGKGAPPEDEPEDEDANENQNEPKNNTAP